MFISKNRLGQFEFHDAAVTSAKFAGGDLIWRVSDINVSSENPQNKNKTDMCVKKAAITFRKAKIERIVLETFQDSKTLPPEESETVPPEDYSTMFDTSLGDRINIGGLDIYRENPDGTFSARFAFEMAARRNFFVDLTFTESVVQWEKFSGIAWYEHPPE